MGDLGGTQLLGNNSHQPSFQSFEVSPTELFKGQHNPFEFLRGTSPDPGRTKSYRFGSLLDSQNNFSESNRLSPYDANNLHRPTSPSEAHAHASPSPAAHQPSRLDIPLVMNQAKYGQLTPPSETQSTRAEATQLGGYQAVSPPGSNTQSKRNKADTTAPMDPSESAGYSSPRRKKSRKQLASRPSAGLDEKRSQFLERNRVAASKCRQKKKEWTTNLEERARELQASKTSLSILVSSLREELLYLKGEALRHTTCDCDAIRNYLARPSTTSFARNHLNVAHSPASGSCLSFSGLDLMDSSSVMPGSPHSSAGPDSQELAGLGIFGDMAE